jgi:hypothetical protein
VQEWLCELEDFVDKPLSHIFFEASKIQGHPLPNDSYSVLEKHGPCKVISLLSIIVFVH